MPRARLLRRRCVFSTANVSKEAVRLAGITKRVAAERAREEGIVVEESPQASVSPPRGS